jgi:hypothetical protein
MDRIQPQPGTYLGLKQLAKVICHEETARCSEYGRLGCIGGNRQLDDKHGRLRRHLSD